MSFVEVPNGIVYTQCPHGRDDKAIRPGETLYGNDGKAWKIKAVGPTFCYADEGGRSYRLRAEWLTHKLPDSWERLREDIVRALVTSGGTECVYFGHSNETGCEDCRACAVSDPCGQIMAEDIVARAKRLAEADHD